MPFGRIINNTIAQTPFGIQVVYNASPTILNNIIAETKTGIFVDSTSSSTVIGASVYQNNTKNLDAPSGFTQTNAIVLAATAPLFVDSSSSNFYLAAGSKAIDSSVDSVPERLAVQAVTSPLGIPPSPIKASDYDLLGQLRVDDPNVASPNGVGGNVFKDRGAIERADVFGPIAVLLNPVDNDAALLDRSQVVNQVVLVGQTLKEFKLQLNDAGLGIDDTTLSAAKFAITRTIGTTTTTLTPGIDYTIAVDDTQHVIDILPAEGLWINATYVITLNNSSDPIKDLAGNNLQPNDQTGATKFTIQLTDTAISPWQNQANKYDVNGDGLVSGIDALFVINHLLLGESEELPAAVTVPPYLDVTGDGNLSPLDALQVINYLNTLSTVSSQSALASPATAVASPVAATASDVEPAATGSALAASATSFETSTAASPMASTVPATASTMAPASLDASAIAFSITVGTSGTDGASVGNTSVVEAGGAKASTNATDGSPSGSQQLAAVDDVWASDDWDADGDWDGVVADLFDESDQSEMAVA